MSVEIRVPTVGESIVEGVLSRWLAEDGAAVTKGQSLFELETDKTTTEIPSPEAGVLKRGAAEGDVVQVGGVVGIVDPNGTASAGANKPAAAPARASAPPPPAPRANVPPPAVPAAAPAPAAAAPAPAPAAPAGARNVRRERMTRLRKTIADRMVEAQKNAAILSTFNEADMSAVMALRSKYKESFKEKHGVGLGFMSFFVKACVIGIREFPMINASIEGDEIVYHDYCDFGVAVGGDRDLIVPVVRNAETLSFAEIEKAIADLAARARAGKIEIDELQGGTFTLSNVGVYSPLLGTPIINPPQSAILGMYAIKDRPIVDEKKQIVARPMMNLALSYDHRLLDGKDAVSFLVRVKECIENPERLMMDI